jgi:hypothetical protein
MERVMIWRTCELSILLVTCSPEENTLHIPRMILSRNEWNTAAQYGPAFEFHLWNLSDDTLTIFSVEDIRPHIPTDYGGGKWGSVEIRPALS